MQTLNSPLEAKNCQLEDADLVSDYRTSFPARKSSWGLRLIFWGVILGLLPLGAFTIYMEFVNSFPVEHRLEVIAWTGFMEHFPSFKTFAAITVILGSLIAFVGCLSLVRPMQRRRAFPSQLTQDVAPPAQHSAELGVAPLAHP